MTDCSSHVQNQTIQTVVIFIQDVTKCKKKYKYIYIQDIRFERATI